LWKIIRTGDGRVGFAFTIRNTIGFLLHIRLREGCIGHQQGGEKKNIKTIEFSHVKSCGWVSKTGSGRAIALYFFSAFANALAIKFCAGACGFGVWACFLLLCVTVRDVI
jgi:hypothetical protein